jgi:hypothetical protein
MQLVNRKRESERFVQEINALGVMKIENNGQGYCEDWKEEVGDLTRVGVVFAVHVQWEK